MNNVEIFIEEFNKLHKVLPSKEKEFGNAIKTLNHNPIIRKHKAKLELARKLRNILVHENRMSKVATPTNSIIKSLTEIRRKFENPATVNEFTKDVRIFDVKDTIYEVLKVIKKESISQFPVFDEENFKGIFSDNGITNWLAKKKMVYTKETTIKDILSLDEHIESYQIVRMHKPLYEIEEIFYENIQKRGDANIIILITPMGDIKNKTDIRGIITPWDFPELLTKL